MSVSDFIVDKIDRKLERKRLKQFGIASYRIDEFLKLKRIERELLFSFHKLSMWGINVKPIAKPLSNSLSRLQNSVLTENKCNLLLNIDMLILENDLSTYFESIETDFKFRKSAGFYLKELRKKRRAITDLDIIVFDNLLKFKKYIDFSKQIPKNIETNINRLVKSYMYLAQSIADNENLNK